MKPLTSWKIHNISNNAKKDIEDYVEKTKTWKDKFNHFINIFQQYSNKYNNANELYNEDMTNIIKTKRVEYITTLPRFTLPDEAIERMTVAERAEHTLVNEMKLWGQKYAILSFIIGINFTGVLFISIFRNHGRVARLLFSGI